MKRWAAVLVCLALMISCCSSAFAAEDSAILNSENEALVHSLYESLVAVRSRNNTWFISNYVDEFNDPTGKKYISSSFSGTFNNSATTNSELKADLLVDLSGVYIFLYEYGSYPVNNISPYNDYYDVSIKDSFGNKCSLEGVIFPNGDRIRFNESDSKTIVDFLASGEEISFSIINSERTLEHYLFSVVGNSNFSAIYTRLTGKELTRKQP